MVVAVLFLVVCYVLVQVLYVMVVAVIGRKLLSPWLLSARSFASISSYWLQIRVLVSGYQGYLHAKKCSKRGLTV